VPIRHFNHRPRAVATGQTLRVEVPAAAMVRWTVDDWATHRNQPTRDTTLGVHSAGLPTACLPAGGKVRFIFALGRDQSLGK
jgi:glucoamylase